MQNETKSKELFGQGGWSLVWQSIANHTLSPESAAKFAEKKARELEGRPPLDPFWLEGEASHKKFALSDELKAKVFLAWLNEADLNDAWEKERLGFESMYLQAIRFVRWDMSAEWPHQVDAKTLAEATIFEIPREDIFEWHWDWKNIRNEWFAQVAEMHPTKLEKALTFLEKNREKWTHVEKEKVFVLMGVWEEHAFAKQQALDSVPELAQVFPVWEKLALEWKNNCLFTKKGKPTL